MGSVVSRLGGAAALVATVAAAPVAASTLPAFPGAEGFGAFATGGRGGRVIYVTNLATSGRGSLQWALNQTGRRYVLFKVSGLIDGPVHLGRGDVTIAGETSPGGITIRGLVTDEQPFQDQEVRAPTSFAENWILRNIRIRPGVGGSDDGLRMRYTRNAIVDRVSIGNATDEAVEISYSSNITIQSSIIAETLGDHAFYGGMLINYSNPVHGFPLDRMSIHHNLFVRIVGRLPEVSRESRDAANSRLRLELSNNLYWDAGYNVVVSPDTGVVVDGQDRPYPAYTDLNMVNNRMVVRRSFPYGMVEDRFVRDPDNAHGNRLFVSGNTLGLYRDLKDYQLFYCCNDFRTGGPDTSPILAEQRGRRLAFPRISYMRGGQLRGWMPAHAGAFPRDPMDLRLLTPVVDGRIAQSPRHVNPAGDAFLPAFPDAPPAPPTDTDGDGMPDAWEIAKGLNPQKAGANARTLSTLGYTNLEVYLHERAEDLRLSEAARSP